MHLYLADPLFTEAERERINLMILESVNELSSSIEQLLHRLRYAAKTGGES